MNKSVTLADIAEIAGVSRSTASRALQDSTLISDATKRRVQKIARQHNYRPNLVARSLRLQHNRTVAFVLPFKQDRDHLMDPFLSKFIGAIGVALRAHDYDLLITQGSTDDADIGARYLQSGRADGIVFVGRTHADEHLVAQMAADAPMAVWGPQLPQQTYCTVGIDNVYWSQQAVSHLLAQGRRRIAFLSDEAGCIEIAHRYQGYAAALREADIPVDPALIAHVSAADLAGEQAMRRLLQRAPQIDGVFAKSDVVAIAAMQVLQENGRAVPDDVAVVGFDNIAMGSYTSPSLTTVSQNLTQGAPLLVEKLLQLINGETAASETIPGRLVIRQSTGGHPV